MDNQDTSDLAGFTADIVAAYVSNNTLRAEEVGALIGSVHAALQQSGRGQQEPVAEPQNPAVPIKKSVTPDYIISLEDGRKFKSLKRHLRTNYDMTPDEYRSKWGLPRDYPMVAPNYAKSRSELARSMGLGRKPAAPAPAAKAPRARRAKAEAA